MNLSYTYRLWPEQFTRYSGGPRDEGLRSGSRKSHQAVSRGANGQSTDQLGPVPVWNTRADSRFAPSQWETASLCNGVSHWLGTSLKSARPKYGLSMYGDSQYSDKIDSRPSYLYNRNPYTVNTESLYWDGPRLSLKFNNRRLRFTKLDATLQELNWLEITSIWLHPISYVWPC